jgi:hypothetical protein
VYHLELRQFPHKTTEFNMSEEVLRAIVEPWVREQYVEVGERKWISHHATLTILEGPKLPPNELSMGRGWAAAVRSSEDVTDRILGGAGKVAAATSATPADLLTLLGDSSTALLLAWRAAAAASPGLTPSETLALAERMLAAAGGAAA